MITYGLLQRVASSPLMYLVVAAVTSVLIPVLARVFTRWLGRMLSKSRLTGAKFVRSLLKEATVKDP